MLKHKTRKKSKKKRTSKMKKYIKTYLDNGVNIMEPFGHKDIPFCNTTQNDKM